MHEECSAVPLVLSLCFQSTQEYQACFWRTGQARVAQLRTAAKDETVVSAPTATFVRPHLPRRGGGNGCRIDMRCLCFRTTNSFYCSPFSGLNQSTKSVHEPTYDVATITVCKQRIGHCCKAKSHPRDDGGSISRGRINLEIAPISVQNQSVHNQIGAGPISPIISRHSVGFGTIDECGPSINAPDHPQVG